MNQSALCLFSFCFVIVVASTSLPLEPLANFRARFDPVLCWHMEHMQLSGQTHRKTIDGRLCAAAYVHNSHSFTVCVVWAIHNVLCSTSVLCVLKRIVQPWRIQKESLVASGVTRRLLQPIVCLIAFCVPFIFGGRRGTGGEYGAAQVGERHATPRSSR